MEEDTGIGMTLFQHLEELRSRLIKSVIVFLILSVVVFSFGFPWILMVLKAPLDALDPNTTNPIAKFNPLIVRIRPFLASQNTGSIDTTLYARNIFETFAIKFKVALLGGAVVGAPYYLYHLWAFIGAGLLKRERKIILRYLPLSVFLFIFGVVFSYLTVVPVMVIFLVGVGSDIGVKLIPMIGEYVSNIVITLSLFGLAFELPLVMLALVKVGITSTAGLWKGWRFAIVIIFLAAGILTPSPDPFSQCLLAFPMIGLYFFGIFLAYRAERHRAKTA